MSKVRDLVDEVETLRQELAEAQAAREALAGVLLPGGYDPAWRFTCTCDGNDRPHGGRCRMGHRYTCPADCTSPCPTLVTRIRPLVDYARVARRLSSLVSDALNDRWPAQETEHDRYLLDQVAAAWTEANGNERVIEQVELLERVDPTRTQAASTAPGVPGRALLDRDGDVWRQHPDGGDRWRDQLTDPEAGWWAAATVAMWWGPVREVLLIAPPEAGEVH